MPVQESKDGSLPSHGSQFSVQEGMLAQREPIAIVGMGTSTFVLNMRVTTDTVSKPQDVAFPVTRIARKSYGGYSRRIDLGTEMCLSLGTMLRRFITQIKTALGVLTRVPAISLTKTSEILTTPSLTSAILKLLGWIHSNENF